MADQKLTALTELAVPISSDILYVVDNPGGTPLSRKATLQNLVGAITLTLTNKTIAFGNNTVSGTKAQFDTAVTDDNFAYLATANIFTETQRIRRPTFPEFKLELTGFGVGSSLANVTGNAQTADATPQDYGKTRWLISTNDNVNWVGKYQIRPHRTGGNYNSLSIDPNLTWVTEYGDSQSIQFKTMSEIPQGGAWNGTASSLRVGAELDSDASDAVLTFQGQVPEKINTQDAQHTVLLIAGETKNDQTDFTTSIVGADIRAFIQENNANGRAFALRVEARHQTGGTADGKLSGVEIGIKNAGTDEDLLSAENKHIGLQIGGEGTVAMTAAIFVLNSTAAFHHGIYMNSTAILTTGDDSFLELNTKYVINGDGNQADPTDRTKAVAWDISGATTAKKTTLTFAQTLDRVITFPNATDTLVGKATTDILSNKDFNADTCIFADPTTNTKEVGFDIAGASAATKTTLDFNQTANRTVTFPDFAVKIGNSIGKQQHYIPANLFRPDGIRPSAAIATVQPGATGSVARDMLAFDQTVIEEAHAIWIPPAKWDLGTVDVTFYWSTQAGTGDARWNAQASSVDDNDLMSGARGTLVAVTDTKLANNDLMITGTITVTVGGSPAAGHWVEWNVRRHATNAADTLTGDAELLGILLEYTVTDGVDVTT